MKRLTQAEVHQRAFDRAVRGVIRQDGPSLEVDDCVYRTADGKRRCAIGHLITKSEYAPYMEGESVYGLKKTGRLSEDSFLVRSADEFLEDLQDAHDSAAGETWEGEGTESRLPVDFTEEFKKRARRMAEKYGLSAEVAA